VICPTKEREEARRILSPSTRHERASCRSSGQASCAVAVADDPVAQVLQPMGVNLAVGLGDERVRAHASHEAGARLFDSII
jgi:hypothetical protein